MISSRCILRLDLHFRPGSDLHRMRLFKVVAELENRSFLADLDDVSMLVQSCCYKKESGSRSYSVFWE